MSGTWTLLEIENTDIVDNGLALSGSTASGWSFDVDNSGANGLLTATYTVPEPGALGMVVLGALLLVCVRRRS
ncbi:MAG: PEP-CTERM sorting domain-containing protein [Planctomycetota bacterium]